MNKKLLDKPLGEWTLQELQQWCDSDCSDCADCPFENKNSIKCSLVQSIPSLWKLQSKPRWTKQDIEDAKAIKRLFPDVHSVTKNANILGQVFCPTEIIFGSTFSNAFPGLKAEETVKISDILASEVD